MGHVSKDSSNDAQVSYIGGLQEGDVVVAATDGLFDNISDGDIIDIVHEMSETKQNPQSLALQLTTVAHRHSLSKHNDTPYSVAATAEYGMIYSGGKPDDITCIVAYVQQGPTASTALGLTSVPNNTRQS